MTWQDDCTRLNPWQHQQTWKLGTQQQSSWFKPPVATVFQTSVWVQKPSGVKKKKKKKKAFPHSTKSAQCLLCVCLLTKKKTTQPQTKTQANKKVPFLQKHPHTIGHTVVKTCQQNKKLRNNAENYRVPRAYQIPIQFRPLFFFPLHIKISVQSQLILTTFLLCPLLCMLSHYCPHLPCQWSHFCLRLLCQQSISPPLS